MTEDESEDDLVTEKQRAIIDAVKENPRLTQREIAELVEPDVSRSLVASVVVSRDDLLEIREAYQSGFLVPADDDVIASVAMIAEENGSSELAARIKASRELDDVAAVWIELLDEDDVREGDLE